MPSAAQAVSSTDIRLQGKALFEQAKEIDRQKKRQNTEQQWIAATAGKPGRGANKDRHRASTTAGRMLANPADWPTIDAPVSLEGLQGNAGGSADSAELANATATAEALSAAPQKVGEGQQS